MKARDGTGVLHVATKKEGIRGMSGVMAEPTKTGVNILDPRQLLACAQDSSSQGRAKLAEAVSTFFSENKMTDHEQALASEIMFNLIRQAEIDLREALSERLSILENIPAEIAIYLANDEISVARHVLMHSPVLNDVDLIYTISNKQKEHWQVIAQREGISATVADRLIDTKDPGTVLNLIDNQRVNLQKSSLKKLVKVALRSEELQAPLLRRPEIDTDIAIDLYMIVSQALRKEIAARFNFSSHAIDQAMEGIIQDLSNEAKGLSETTPDMVKMAHKFEEHRENTPDLMIKTLRRGQLGFFLALFAERTRLPLSGVSRLLEKDGGKHFVVACRSISMMKSEFASLFLLSRGIRTGDKIVDQRELAMALKSFDAIKDHDVQRIMGAWIKNPEMI